MKRLLSGLLLSTVLLGGFTAVEANIPDDAQPEMYNSRVVVLRDEVDDAMLAPLLYVMEHQHNKPILVDITGPGGGSEAVDNAILAMKYESNLDTYVGHYAYSADENLWMAGKNRYIEPDASVLFHSCLMFVSDSIENESTVSERLSLLRDPEFASFAKKGIIIPFSQIKLDIDIVSYNIVAKSLPKLGYTQTLLQTQITYLLLHQANVKQLGQLSDWMKKSGHDEAWVIHNLFHDFKENVAFTGQQLFDMGIATHLGRPNLDKYN